MFGMWAIKNKRTGQWLTGTDYKRCYPEGRCHQYTSNNKALTYDSRKGAENALLKRKCGKDYKVVSVELKEARR